MTFEKHTITNFHISFNKNKFDVQLFKKEKQGSLLYTFDSELFEIIWYSSDHTQEKILDFIKELHVNFEESLKTIYNQIGGVFEIFIYDKKNNKLFTVSDLYGVNGSFYLIKNNQINFFLNFQNFVEFQMPLQFDKIGVQAHFAFGYQVQPFPLPYQGISRLEGGKLHVFDENLKKTEKSLKIDFSTEKPSFSLKNALNVAKNLFFGATAGKDSLTLFSQVEEGNATIKTGNFGEVYSADVIQGKEIAVNLGVSYSHTTLCDEEEFEYYANQIANISGGLATISYVDMLKFVNEGIPHDYSFVMGEAGECVRMFFPEDSNLAKALHNYLTPKEFLSESFVSDYESFINEYPGNISTEITKNYDGNSNAEILINFYRKGRLPGNFGNRHKILSAYRNKITPFLHEDFIKQTHHLPLKRYQYDQIHEQIVYDSNQDLLTFFKNPIKSDISVQDWNHRISNEIGEQLYKMLNKHIHALNTVFDIEKVLQLAKQQQKNPNRGVYFLFRVLSMAIFADNINNAIAPCEKR
ncbi:hypothetical protein C8N46_104137 [Kordia periserrulae]|uniref:Uncharacterized protein n=1 Tax=Kordia periserrulae TaxID=701523 RepID=A0A2T6BZJ8_9FLAO|nr:hypothetical protein [Kordia periserrulae]PTX61494.1 hypothetical protein C8N46_104137 [Kordia periserrulae]